MGASPWRDDLLRSPSELAAKLGVKWTENMDHEQILELYYRRQGRKKVHCCPDWDYMAIHEDSPEFVTCTCKDL
jgi:hypothetical protein